MKAKYTSVCSKVKLSEIRLFVAEQLKEVPLNNKEKNQIILAIDEACANAIIHGNECDESKVIHLTLESDSHKLRIEIADEGIHNVPHVMDHESDIEHLIREKRKGGIGLKLINKIMDDIRFFKRENKNVCVLTKTLS